MKPDGTYNVDEILQICNDQLQAWEREELAEKLTDYSFIEERIANMDPEDISDITGYYFRDTEPEEKEVEDFLLCDIIDGLVFKLGYMKLRPSQREELLKAMNSNLLLHD